MKYRMIERCREAFPIRMMCRHFKVSASGLMAGEDENLAAEIWPTKSFLHISKNFMLIVMELWALPEFGRSYIIRVSLVE